MSMVPTPLVVGGSDPALTVLFAQLLAYSTIAVAATILLFLLVLYVRRVLAEGFEYEWGYLAAGVGAAVVYGVSGIVAQLTSLPWVGVFTEGAVLFFILFVALGIRAMYHAERTAGDPERLLPAWLDYLVIVGFVVAWWASFLGDGNRTRLVVAAGWVAASVWAIVYGVQTVRRYEGTTMAALIRHLLPAIVCAVAVIMVDLGAVVIGLEQGVVDAAWLVGTVLVAAFLFNTAVAIRQQEGEVERMYDQTTWREQAVDE